jgi:hypothetical protein
MKKPTKREQAAAEIFEDAESAQEEQEQLAELFEKERLKLEQAHRDRLRAAELEHAGQLADLERRKLVALGGLWKKQGRQLGAGLLRVMEDAHGSAR